MPKRVICWTCTECGEHLHSGIEVLLEAKKASHLAEHEKRKPRWIPASALEVADHAAGRTALRGESTIVPAESDASEVTTVWFTDGTAFRLSLFTEHQYSENTADSARVTLELFKVVSQ